MHYVIIIGAKYLIALSPVLVAVYLFKIPKHARRYILIFFLLSLPVTFLLSLLAQELYYNPRPFVTGGFEPLIAHAPNNGFPSNHALLSSALAAGITFFNRRVATWLWIMAGIVSISRVYAGVHSWIDVLASAFIAVSVALGVHVFLKRYSSAIIQKLNQIHE